MENPLSESGKYTRGIITLCFRRSRLREKDLSARNSYGTRPSVEEKEKWDARLRSIDTRIEVLGNRLNLCGAQVAYRRPACLSIVISGISQLRSLLEVCNQQVHIAHSHRNCIS